MQTEIVSLTDVTNQNELISQIQSIFFESSSRSDFASQEERDQFRFKYLDLYLRNPELVWIAWNTKREVLGYILGAEKTTKEHYQLHPYLLQFQMLIDSDYPAHLHINLATQARGLGIGSLILNKLEMQLRDRKIPGVHLITSKNARNISFYQKNHYPIVQEHSFNGTSLVMMAKRLHCS
jgi:GNAT superfamily N-acetyltransferase